MPRRSRKNPVIIGAVVERRIAGQSKSQISNELGIARNTVSAILTDTNTEQRLIAGREQCADLIPIAVQNVESNIRKGSESAAFRLLEGIGVLGKDVAGSRKGDVSLNVAIANLLPPTAQPAPIATDAAIDAKVIDSDPSTQNAGGDGKSNT